MKRSTFAISMLSVILATCAAMAAEKIDPRGPIEYPAMKVVVKPGEVQAPGYVFKNDCQKPTPWQAKWIWIDESAVNKSVSAVAVMFRKEVTLEEMPTSVKAWLTADIKYRLYINGKLVSRGPVDIGRDYAGGNTHRWFYDYRDLTKYFVSGKNVIAAEVFTNWAGGDNISRGKPGFLFEAEVATPRTTFSIKSDRSWRTEDARQYPGATTYMADEEPEGWRMPGFDDSKWTGSSIVQDIWSPLVASDIPPLMEASYPVARIEGLKDNKILKDGSFRVVFDRVLSARPTLKVRGRKGTVMFVRAHHTALVALCDGETAFEFPCMTEVAPSYTVEFKNVTSPVEILEAGANFTSQPVEYRGEFSCSDEKLNKLWKVSRWTTQICLQSHHLDSPNHQEPICDPGDYVIESMVNHYAFAQPWLARQDIRKFAWLLKDEKYSNFHTSYSIAWLQMLMDYYDYTGDDALLNEMAPYVYALMDKYESWRGKNGLVSEAPNYMFMDWVVIGGFECHHPPAVIGQGYLTAQYYHGLEMASTLAAMVGSDCSRIMHYGTLRKEVREAFNRELWVADKGLYRDGKPFQTKVKPNGWLPADKDIETFSPHVNLLAVLYGLAPVEDHYDLASMDKKAAIVEKVIGSGAPNTQPWFMHWGFQAIDYAGVFDRYGTAQMRRWEIVPETQSFREMWHSGDLSHGWCSTPLVQMSSVILGVKPERAGFTMVGISPHLCDLQWAKGIVPTPQGNVAVSWKLEADRFTLDVSVPEGSDANIHLPGDRFENPTVRIDEKLSNFPDFRASVPSGKHHVVVAGKLKPK